MKVKKTVLLSLILLTIINVSFAQDGMLGTEKFAKISVPEKITKQMITETKESMWIFTDKYLNYFVGDGEVIQLKISTFQYDNTEHMYTFVCTDKDKTEFTVQYKNEKPRHALIQSMDGKIGFMCHN